MKIIYNENPLRTVVELDEHDRQILRLKIKIEELKDNLSDVHFRLTEGESDSKSLLTAAARQALNAADEETEKAATAVFEPSLEITKSKITGLRTIAELNESAAANAQNDLIYALAESSARLGRLDRAIALERLRASETKRP